MAIINLSTFQPISVAGGRELGTVEVTIRGETRRVRAYRWEDGDVTAYGMTGRYQTGAKAWKACVMASPKRGTEVAHFGRDDNHPKFRKEQCLHFSNEEV